MEKHFMLDIESTGIDSSKEDLLQIGILEADFDGNKWVAGRTLEIIQHTDKKPESVFAKEHMAKLYEVCNRAPKWEAENIRWMLWISSRSAAPRHPKFTLWDGTRLISTCPSW